MATDIWPVDWPDGQPAEGADPKQVARAELFAGTVLRQLTLGRVGGRPITVMPCAQTCHAPYYGATGNGFHPVLLENGAYANCWCGGRCTCRPVEAVELAPPVGRIDNVTVGTETLDPSAYHVEDGHLLVRTDGKRWPACAGDGFTVTYLNAYPVDQLGGYAAGVLAGEYLKAMTGGRGCRLPSNVTNIARAGVTMEFAQGMFPDGMTGIKEIDSYLMQWNPHGMKVAPKVYSIDRPAPRQVTWP
jgi:hypothetical protein